MTTDRAVSVPPSEPQPCCPPGIAGQPLDEKAARHGGLPHRTIWSASRGGQPRLTSLATWCQSTWSAAAWARRPWDPQPGEPCHPPFMHEQVVVVDRLMAWSCRCRFHRWGLLPGRIPCDHARIAELWPESVGASSPMLGRLCGRSAAATASSCGARRRAASRCHWLPVASARRRAGARHAAGCPAGWRRPPGPGGSRRRFSSPAWAAMASPSLRCPAAPARLGRGVRAPPGASPGTRPPNPRIKTG